MGLFRTRLDAGQVLGARGWGRLKVKGGRGPQARGEQNPVGWMGFGRAGPCLERVFPSLRGDQAGGVGWEQVQGWEVKKNELSEENSPDVWS